MTDERYYKKDSFGRDVFDFRAYDDDEQMRILSQMRQEEQLKKSSLASHSIFSFFKRKKSLISTHTR